MADETPHQVVGDDQWRRPERLEVVPELVDGTLALHIAAWADHGSDGRRHGLLLGSAMPVVALALCAAHHLP